MIRRKTRKTAGIIGLGIIGQRAAAGLRAAGFQTYVWNRSPKPAPNFLGSPAEVASATEIIQLFVGDAPALFEMIAAMSEALTPAHVIVCSATVGVEATLEAAKLVQGTGARFLDAPFTGSKVAAERRELVYYVGGDEETFLRAKPVLEATSRSIVRIGRIGEAALIKVVTNMIAATSIQVLAEALAITKKAGLNPEVLSAALEQNACRSGTMDLKLPKMMSGDYEPHFSLKNMLKDLQFGIQLANALQLEIPATTVTAGVMYGAMNQGWGEQDFASIFRLYENGLRVSQAVPELGHRAAPPSEPAATPEPPQPAPPPATSAAEPPPIPAPAPAPAPESKASAGSKGPVEIAIEVETVKPDDPAATPLNRRQRFFPSRGD